MDSRIVHWLPAPEPELNQYLVVSPVSPAGSGGFASFSKQLTSRRVINACQCLQLNCASLQQLQLENNDEPTRREPMESSAGKDWLCHLHKPRLQVVLPLLGRDGGAPQRLPGVDPRGSFCVLCPLRYEIPSVPVLPDPCGEEPPTSPQHGGARQ